MPRNLRNWPRCHACCFGVFIPLNVIVVISLVVGLLLGGVEMQEEINGNDNYMRLQMADVTFKEELEATFVDQLPQLCLSLFQENITADSFDTVFENIMTNETLANSYLQVRNSTGDNTTDTEPEIQTIPHNKSIQEMSQFFADCGQAATAFREDFLSLFQPPPSNTREIPVLTFNYIRCVNRSSPLRYNVIMWPSEQDVNDALYDSQASLYSDSWSQSQQDKQAEYLEEGKTELEALTESFADATGGAKCAVNIPSAGE